MGVDESSEARQTATSLIRPGINSNSVAGLRMYRKLSRLYSPPETGGVAAPSKSLERRGRGGHSGLTTPSALSKVASQHFLDAQPPLLS